MQIHRSGLATLKGPADWFTGDVYVDLLGPMDATRLNAGNVHFTPGARTHWHSHRLGQLIYVTEGEGRCQRDGGAVEIIRAGDVVFFEPDENHWHGAAPDRFMVHVAINAPDMSGNSTSWGRPVSYDQYRGDGDAT